MLSLIVCLVPISASTTVRLISHVVQRAFLTWYSTSLAPVWVGACVWGPSSHTEFGWVSLSSSGSVLLSIISSAEGSDSDSFLPHIGLSGAPDSSDHLPDLSALECEFSDLPLQIARLQQCQSGDAVALWEYISSTAEAKCFWVFCPQVFLLFFFKTGNRNWDNKSLIVYMDSCMRRMLRKTQ